MTGCPGLVRPFFLLVYSRINLCDKNFFIKIKIYLEKSKNRCYICGCKSFGSPYKKTGNHEFCVQASKSSIQNHISIYSK